MNFAAALSEPWFWIFFAACICAAFLFGAYFGTAIAGELARDGNPYEDTE